MMLDELQFVQTTCCVSLTPGISVKMGNLVTFIDSNSNSHTLKFRNIFQVTMHIHTCFEQFLQQFGEIDRIIILSME